MKKRFRCFGGHKINRILIAFLLINVPAGVFNWSVLNLYKNSIITTIAIFMQLLSTLLMFITGLMDPGVIPKNEFGKESRS